jgi:hypothetical protein
MVSNHKVFLFQLSWLKPGIINMQEVDTPYFSVLEEELGQSGFKGSHEPHFKGKNGLATFYNTKRFRLEKIVTYNFNELLSNLFDLSQFDKNNKFNQRVVIFSHLTEVKNGKSLVVGMVQYYCIISGNVYMYSQLLNCTICPILLSYSLQGNSILFTLNSILFPFNYIPILFPFFSILCYSILFPFYYIPFYSILFYSIPFHSILFPFYSIPVLFYFIPFYSSLFPFFSTLFYSHSILFQLFSILFQFYSIPILLYSNYFPFYSNSILFPFYSILFCARGRKRDDYVYSYTNYCTQIPTIFYNLPKSP